MVPRKDGCRLRRDESGGTVRFLRTQAQFVSIFKTWRSFPKSRPRSSASVAAFMRSRCRAAKKRFVRDGSRRTTEPEMIHRIPNRRYRRKLSGRFHDWTGSGTQRGRCTSNPSLGAGSASGQTNRPEFQYLGGQSFWDWQRARIAASPMTEGPSTHRNRHRLRWLSGFSTNLW